MRHVRNPRTDSARPGPGRRQTLEVQGMNLEHYAALLRLLEPFGVRLQSVDADRILYRVNGSADQLRAQLSLAKLQELPAEAPQPTVAGAPAVVAPTPTPVAPSLRFRW